MDDITPLMTIAQAAALLGLHPDTLRRDIRNGKLEAYRRPRATRISRPALQAYLDRFKSPQKVASKSLYALQNLKPG